MNKENLACTCFTNFKWCSHIFLVKRNIRKILDFQSKMPGPPRCGVRAIPRILWRELSKLWFQSGETKILEIESCQQLITVWSGTCHTIKYRTRIGQGKLGANELLTRSTILMNMSLLAVSVSLSICKVRTSWAWSCTTCYFEISNIQLYDSKQR